MTTCASESSTDASTTPQPAQPSARSGSWAAVVSLGLGIFSIVGSEFLPASLLPQIASGLRVSDGAAGQAVTATAFAAAVSALLISVVLPRADRRRVMMGLTLLAIISNVIVALAPNLYVLLLARLLIGIALGGFWAMATAMASRLVHPDHVGRALTVINTGVSLATIAAVPVGAWFGGLRGWRSVFVLAAGVGVVALIVQAATLPHISPAATSRLRALGSVLRSPVVWGGLLAILLIFSGHFGGYTYIRPATTSLAGIGAGDLALLLLVFGVANVAGTALSGPVADRVPRLGLYLFPAVLGAGMLLMLLIGTWFGGLLIAAVLWGFGFGGVPTTGLSWGARTEPTHLEQIGGVIVTFCNIGICLGAVVGGVLVDTISPATPLLFGGAAAILGALVLGSLRRRA